MKRLQSLSYKTLFTIFFLALAGIVFFLKIGSKTEKVSAAWWDDMWHYRKAISIDNSSGSDLADFQVALSIGTSQLIADGKMQNNCNDIRVTDINGNLLPYWIEPNTCNTDTTNIYTKINSLFTNGISVYIYYGNNSAESASDATAVPQTCSKVNSYFGTNLYYINPEGKKNSTPVQAYCDMTTDGGGWTLVASWNTSQEWTKASYSSSDVFGTTAKDTVSSNFGNAPINDFRILASDTITSIGTSAYADWYYHYNSTTTWKEVWARSSNIGGNIDSTYRSTTTRQSLKPFNYSYNIKFSYQVTQTYNNLSDWGINTSSYYGLPNYWLALTSPGNKFGIYGAVAGGGANDGSLAICPSNISNCISGQDMSTNNCKIGYDDNIPSASFGSIGTTSVNQNPPIEVTTKLWWFIRDGTPVSNAYSVSSSSSEEVGTGPIAYWKFDEGSGTTAYDSAGTSNGTISSATYTLEDQCINGKCLNFNGSGSPYINIPNNNLLNFGTNDFTISAWALNRDYTYPKSNFMIKKSARCYDDGTSNSGFDIGHGYESNGIDICFHDTSNNYIHTTLVFNNGFQPSQLINKWTHYEFIFNRTLGKIIVYINGVKQNNELNISSVTGNIDNTSALTMGTMYGWQTDGLYDEVKIYPYARTADQIKLDYNSRGSSKGTSVNLGIKSNTAPSLSSKLIAHYKFDEGQGTIVNNWGNGGVGLSGVFATGSSAPTWDNNGKISKALNFDGNDYVDISNIPDLQNTFTLSVWVNPSQFSDLRPIICKDGNTNGNLLLRFDDTGNIEFRQYTGVEIRTTESYSQNEWIHITAVSDNLNGKIFVNGKLVKTGTFGQSFSDTGNIRIGRYSYSSGYFFNGLIDDVKIYNYALTAEEIKQDYNSGSAIQFGSTNQTIGGTTTSLEYCIPGDTSYCASPVAEWKMDEGVGTSIVDTSGNNNTGTISGATWNQGKIGKGLKFNGSNNYIEVSSTPSTTGSFTISTWVKAINGSTSDGYGYIIHRSNVSSIGGSVFFLGINPTGNYIGAVNGHYANGDTGIAANENIWRFLTLSYDGNTQKVYVDGQLKSNYSFGAITNTTTDNKIGFGGTPLYLNYRNIKGQMDQVRIYDYARTPAQIAYDYNKGGPVGWWKFDECQGNTAYDWSGIGNTGVISIGSGGSQNSLGTCQIGTSAAWTNGATGKINSSLNFDGVDDYIDTNKTIIPTKDFSITSWFYTTNQTNYQPIISQYASSQNGRLWFGLYNNTFGYRIGSQSQTINTETNKWIFGTITRKNGEVNLYLNGQLKNTSTASEDIYQTNTKIGGDSGFGFFQGQIDDVRIYNFALTSEQVKTVYNNGAINFQ